MESGYPMSDIAFYFGWYAENAQGPLTRDSVPFMPGLLPTICTPTAPPPSSTERHWVGPLLHAGATATMGCVDEPYLGATPELDVFMEKILMGFSFGEAAYAAQRVLSWQTTVVGIPSTTHWENPFSGSRRRPKPAVQNLAGSVCWQPTRRSTKAPNGPL